MREVMGQAWVPAIDAYAFDGVGAEVASAIAEELMALTGVLSNLAYDLGSDPDTLRKHMGSMQAIDLITQIQVALAEILRSDAPIEKRIEGVTVEALGRRLEARLAGKPYPVEYGEDTSLD